MGFPHLREFFHRTCGERHDLADGKVDVNGQLFLRRHLVALGGMIHCVEIMQPLFVITEKLAGYPDLIAEAAFTLIADVAFNRKSRQAGCFSVGLTEAAQWMKYFHGMVKNKGLVSDIEVAVVIDPRFLNRLLPARYGCL